jgi:hypothetical protein
MLQLFITEVPQILGIMLEDNTHGRYFSFYGDVL